MVHSMEDVQKRGEKGRKKKEEQKERNRAESEEGEAASFFLLTLSFSHPTSNLVKIQQFIDAEHRFGAHNYAPLPVVLERGVESSQSLLLFPSSLSEQDP